MLPIAILAGGRATRLYPLTRERPKSLVRVAGRPFLFHQLEWLRQQGIDEVVLCVGHFADQIEAAVGDGHAFGLEICYSRDGESLVGTGGALIRALPLLGPHFFVTYGDSYLPCSLPEIESAYRSASKPALMTVLRNDDQWDRSNVVYADGRVLEYDKHSTQRAQQTHIDFGLLVFSQQVFSDYTGRTTLDLADVCRDLSLRGVLAGMEVRHRFYEIGSPQGLAATEAFLNGRHICA